MKENEKFEGILISCWSLIFIKEKIIPQKMLTCYEGMGSVGKCGKNLETNYVG
jgi:hypothetical protein